MNVATRRGRRGSNNAVRRDTGRVGQEYRVHKYDRRRTWLLRPLTAIEDVLYVAVAAILVAIAAVLLFPPVADSFTGHDVLAESS